MASGKPAGTGDRTRAGPVRCAVYTRKSTEEGLEQAFNSLDAQREACAAYVLSQVHEGWELLPDIYDDGGFSGGSMNRPALQRLLDDVRRSRVDVIVVYKVDRLTRSLADFSKIVEVLDAAGASFVSVTQAFNTTNSMGRLTLNVLLSFAQFEREVTGERIRDKIAASKMKGMWMGGPIPLGYDVVDRALVINQAEAATVREIFGLHQKFTTLSSLTAELHRRGIRSRVRKMRDGRTSGGAPYRSGAIRHILANRIYIGEISHGERVYKGAHEAIIDRKTWQASQAILAKAKDRPRSGLASPLAGRIKDHEGRSLIPAHANKGGRRYRYYVSSRQAAEACWRLPAGDLEAMVQRAIDSLLSDARRLAAEFGGVCSPEDIGPPPVSAVQPQAAADRLRSTVELIDARLIIAESEIVIEIDRAKLAGAFDIQIPNEGLTEPVKIEVPATLRRRGHELRLVYADKQVQPANRDDRLIDLLGKGWAAWDRLSTGPRIEDAVQRSHLSRLARLRFLAPDITTAILDGRQPVELTARSLLRASELPIAWDQQRKMLGFD